MICNYSADEGALKSLAILGLQKTMMMIMIMMTMVNVLGLLTAELVVRQTHSST